MDNEAKFLEYLKRATADLRKARRRVRELEDRDQEPVAIVGMGCRFPGGVGDPDGFWQLLATGVDAISGFPADRGWDTESLYGAVSGSEASTTRQGGFVYDASGFDADFFGISPREALAMDPQQRVLLETSWEALEQAGIDPSGLRGSATGVFAGAGFSAYGAAVPASDAEGYVVTGNATSVISGRVAYTLGLEGPAVTVDTACSSSLVALHLAVQALRTGECTLALAGGVTVMAEPGTFAEFSRQGGLAFDGRCKAFAAGADGTGWGEGAGMLVVERLSDAHRNGHRVLAVVRGSAVNQDGASNGLTAPNGPSQQRVIRSALASARLSATEVDAVEAHGTGTVLGDPIEAQALLATYGQDRDDDQPLWLGSVKSNIGHTQAAAGVAGVIKMVLAMRHGVLPRTLHAEDPSPYVDWSAGQVRLLTEPVPWPAVEQPRRAGVSAFGISGTNAHVILEEPPARAPAAPTPTPDGPEIPTDADAARPPADAPEAPAGAKLPLDSPEVPAGAAGLSADGSELLAGAGAAGLPVLRSGTVGWLVSGQSADGLRAQASRLAAHLDARPATTPVDVAWSLATTRPALEHRAVVLGDDRDQLVTAVSALAASTPSAAVVAGVAEVSRRVVFVFPGQGSQWVGMGRELAEASPVFAARLAECGRALAPYVDWSLDDVLHGREGAPGLDRVDVVQPVLWAVMVSLAELWQAAGVKPDAVVGHSQGEIAAAVVAGILSLADAAKVVALRSQALIALSGAGGMLSVAAPVDAVATRLAPSGDRLSVAAVNGPAATVVSGEPAALAELADAFERDGVRTRLLPVDYASHGPQVDAIRDEVLRLLAGITPLPARLPMVSAMTGEHLAGPEADAGYWYASLRATVQFSRAVETLSRDEYGAFIEVSAHPVLTTAIAATLETDALEAGALTAPVVSGTLRRDDGGPARLLASLAEVYVRGVAVNWPSVLPEGERVDLPTYAFQRRYYWPKPVPRGSYDGSAADPVSEGEARFWAAVEADDVAGLAGALSVEGGWPFSDVVPAMASWRRRERDRSTVADWRYRVAWTPIADPAPTPLSGTWLVLAPTPAPAAREDSRDDLAAAAAPEESDGDLAATVGRALSARGADVVLVRVAPDALDREALALQIGTVATSAGQPAGVLSLLALDEAPLAGWPVVAGGLAGTLGLVQVLGDAGIAAPLWLLTQGAVAAGPDEALTNPIQAQVWGLGRVAGLEHPDRWGGLIDLPPELDERAAERFGAVLAGCGEDQVVIRPGGIRARRLVRSGTRRTDPVQPWTTRGSVLLTGAGGAIGPDLAAWLARSHVPHAVLASRRGPQTPGAATLAATMAEAGTAVAIAGCDVADRDSVAGLLRWIPTVAAPLSAVIHAAVAVELTPLRDTDVAELALASSAKVAGAAHLDELTADLDLDAFVLFSSITATWGVSDHGSYAAANAYLDALAEHRRSRGLPATSVAWGVWNSGGRFDETPAGEPEQAEEPVHAAEWLPQSLIPDRLRRQGLRLLDPARALMALGQVLAADESAPVVADVDWPRFSAVFNAARSWRLLDEIPEARQVAAEQGAVAVSGEAAELLARLLGVSSTQRERIMTELVRGHAAAVLGHSSPDAVQAARAFRDMGFDSLTAVELRGRLNQATGLRLPSTVVFDYPSPLALARQLLTQLIGSAALTPDEPRVTPVSSADPVVIVGMGCRFPGGADSPEALWELLATGADAISGFPADRGWDLTGLVDAGTGEASYTPEGGFITGMADFDPGFFRISPREALGMDPQQRLLLETSWEALERAGIDPVTLRGSLTGVFTGASSSGYAGQAGYGAGVAGSEGHLMIGNLTSVISGRVSYTLGLEGPAVTVDTACSSALVSLHLAAQALRGGECDLALAGGVMVITDPTEFIGFSHQGALAADARCKAFSADADGMSLSEGVGMLVLERLSDARRNGHPVLAVVAGSAVNQDGASNGLSAPNGPSQQRVIRAALAGAGLRPGDIDVIEAHGTGTALGDPIEAQAILATYGQDRPEERPVLLGSVKSNIGHAQQAAGVAGVIKMVLALRNELLPATLHADVPTPHVDWTAGHVELLHRPMPWTRQEDARPRRAGVSSFGISGTNAHVIIEEAPEEAAPIAGITPPADSTTDADRSADAGGTSGEAVSGTADPRPKVLTGASAAWLVSGHTPAGLTDQARRLAAHLDADPRLDPADVGWSLATTRTALEHRAVLRGETRDDLMAALTALAAGEPSAGVITGTAGAAGPVVFVFPGQGGQWVGMGRELAEASPVFAARLAECGEALAPYVEWDLVEVLGDSGVLSRLDVVHPVLWAVMVSLAAVWEAAGVRPDAVIGHSQGEIAAACVAGVLSLSDGARVVARRGQAMMALAGRGGVLSIAASLEAVEARLRPGVSVATVNGPEAVTVSGAVDALSSLAAECERDGVRARFVPMDYAPHGPQVEGIRGEVLAALEGVVPGTAVIPMVSGMTGDYLDGSEAGPEYWYASLRSTVQFARGVERLGRDGYGVFVEVSPHPVLTTAMAATLETAEIVPVVTGTLRRDEGGPARVLASLAEVHVRGVPVDWTAVLPTGRRVDLPTYAFQRQRYWPKPMVATAAGANALGLGAADHPLLGAAVDLAGGQGLLFTGRLSLRAQPWLADHAIAGTVLLPGTAFVELAVRAGFQAGCPRIEELTLAAPLVLPPEGAVRVQVIVSAPDERGHRAVEVYGQAEKAAGDGAWTRHAAGLLAPATAPMDLESGDFRIWPPDGAEPVDLTGRYEAQAEGGYGFGPMFRGLRSAWRRGGDVFAEVALPEDATDDAAGFGLHPALLDSSLHAAGLAGNAWTGATAGGQEVLLPFAWTGLSLYAAGAARLRVRLRQDADSGGISLLAADTSGALVVSADSLVLRPVAAGALQTAGDALDDSLFAIEWTPISGTPSADTVDRAMDLAVVGADPFGLATGLTACGVQPRTQADLTALAEAVDAGAPVPDLVFAGIDGTGYATDPAQSARRLTGEVLDLLHQWLALDALAPARLVIVSRGAVATEAGAQVTDLAAAAAWGLVRSAQSENPDRLILADLPATGADDDTFAVLAAALGSGEPELAVRDHTARGRRLVRSATPPLTPPATGPWRLDAPEKGALTGLALVPYPEATAPLQAGEVRIAVRAVGLNFRDVLIALGMYPVEALVGTEIAGVVTEIGAGVTQLSVGDRVLGMAAGGAGPLTVTDARLLTRMPSDWSFAAAATVPIAYSTAWYALVDLAAARPGQRLLVHAATGGVGTAAVAVARHLGLEVYATASPGKWAALREMGLDDDHIASSRTADFETAFLAATGGEGMDIVLNALAGELTDASLRLLHGGGMFLEMGKTDVRDPAELARDHPDVNYQAFVTGDAAPERLTEILAETTGLIEDGTLAMPPMRVWDVRRAPEAFRFMSQARHVGKIVLTVPPGREPGTVLITGGTGTLGGLVARHLAATGRATRLVLTSRSGPAARGAAALAADLASAGLGVRIIAGDAADRSALATVLAPMVGSAPVRRAVGERLRGVVHTAGVLDDGVIGSLTPARIDAVLRPKADAAWNLHELTRGVDLDAFVLFSAGAATFGAAGQGNYAAGNAFLDALAAHRLAAGLPAVSLAWGLWADASAMTENLSAQDVNRISQGGVEALTADQGLGLLDLALTRDDALLVPARLDVAGIRAQAALGAGLAPLWRALTGGPARPPMASAVGAHGGSAAEALRQQLAGSSGADRDRLLLDLVRGHVAAVLGHTSPEAVEPRRAFRDLGFDSLTSVELRNRLATATGLRLPATVVFDHPSSSALADHLRTRLLGEGALVTAAPAVAAAAGEPIAIVAMSCRFPGDVQDPEGFWELLAAGTDAISPLPRDRGWDTAGLSEQDLAHVGANTGQGGFISGATDFDHDFFGISPREALTMDPQQRLLLETSWEALERAGLDPGTLRGSATGVYVGAAFSGYGAGLPAELAGHMMTGTAASVMSGRISYTLGLEGPAVTIDTACSSSLVALHLAVAALRAGECTMALAGGATIMATPGGLVSFSQQQALAADGRCKAFSTLADGMGMAEGAGMLVIEKLSDAQRNGHPVLAVIRGSAMNQDGASNGLTAPNGPSQQRVIRAALANARLSPADVDVVEAHGTGTELGDPIEAQALLSTYGQDRPEDRPLWLGSVKSNIGHTQCAAGVASVIKMVLALGHEELPRSLYADRPSTHVDWTEGDIRLLAEAQPWPVNGRARRAGVSSFGISGTNVHLLLEEAPAPVPPVKAATGSLPVLTGTATAWPVSGRTRAALAGQASRLGELVSAQPGLDVEDVAWSLVTSRSVFEHRAVVTGRNREELLSGLSAVTTGLPAAGVVSGEVPVGGGTGRVVFVFPGQGSQWAGMGRELAASSPVFAARLAECGQALAPYVDWSLDDVLAGAAELDRVDVVQPALWAVMVSLAAFWQAAGVEPDAVVGHSQGEIAAAVVAGVLSLDDAAKIVALRSRALTALSGGGGMLSIAESADAVEARVASWDGRVSVAAVNGPGATVVSGEVDALAALLADCERDGVRARMLPVDYASHGPQVDSLREEILSLLDGVTPQPGRIPMVSAMTGEFLEGPEMDAGYWYASLRASVQFSRAIEALGGYGVFIECSPHPVLTAPITATLEGLSATAEPVVTGTLRRDDGGPLRALASLAEVYVRGVGVDWTRVLAEAERVDLPTYAFVPQRFWPAPVGSGSGDVTSAGLDSVGHPLLGASVELAEGEGLVVTGRLSLRAQPWLADHAVAGIVVLPGTALAELAVVAGHQAGCPRIEKLTLTAPLVLSADHPTQVQITLGAPEDGGPQPGRRTVQIYARTETPGDPNEPASSWTWHAGGVLTPARPAEPALARDFLTWPPTDAEPIDLTGLAGTQTAAGHDYGPAFRGLRAAWRQGDDIVAEVALPEPAAAEAGVFGLHPALLDAAFQTTALLADSDMTGRSEPDTTGSVGRGGTGLGEAGGTGVRLPFSWGEVSVYSAGASRLRVRLRATPDGWSLTAADGTGVPVASVGSLELRPVTAGQLRIAGNTLRDALFGLAWVPVPDPTVAVTGPWAVTGPDLIGLGAGLRAVGATVADHPDLDALAAAVEAGEPVPQFVVACLPTAAKTTEQPGEAVRRVTRDVEALVRQWLALESLTGARLVLVTRGAVATGPDQPTPDLTGAAVWGLVRSAQSRNPGRLILADLAAENPDGSTNDRLSMLAASLTSDEPELALRGDTVYGRRLTRPAGGVIPTNPPTGHTPGTVLVTGGPGTAAARAAQHLARTGRATAVTVATRPGPSAPGTATLAATLATAGAAVQIIACDLTTWTDRDRGERPDSGVPGDRGEAANSGELIDSGDVQDVGDLQSSPSVEGGWPRQDRGDVRDIRAGLEGMLGGRFEAPLKMVIHQDDDALTAPDVAWNLHRLTAGLDLDAFVLFSTLTATLGTPETTERTSAQAGFLQALAAHRRAAGLPAIALAWGPSPGGDTAPGSGSEASGKRLAPIADLSEGDALALFDLVLERDEDFLVPARLNLARLRTPADSEPAPVWRSLAGAVGAAEPEDDHSEVAEALRRQLETLSPDDQERMLLTLVRAHVAAVLGQGSPEAIDPRRAFSDLGFDSMIAVELRNRLNTATGLKLPATVVFDYPTTAAVAEYLRESLVLDGAPGVDAEEETLRRILATTAISRFRDAGILDALMRLADPDSATPDSDGGSRAEDIDGLDAESLVRMALDSESADY
ncbi:beta-ketoacyl synthase N-terminal-like domain-containing protein [Nonomuraea sp. ZG12]|uniref:beta-ketoacyl synthase N-terminal-like domain-containing protein n=1 Tax=Nonomuraea sp. ZG12 TaxID=3452207 RepID=UPI003F8A3FD7